MISFITTSPHPFELLNIRQVETKTFEKAEKKFLIVMLGK